MKQVPITCRGHTRPVRDLSFSDVTLSSYLLLSASKDYTAMLREGDTGDWVGTFIGHKGALWAGKLTSNASIAVTGSADFCSKVWDAESGLELLSFEHDGIVKSVDLSSSDNKVLTGTSSGIVRVFDLEQVRKDEVLKFINEKSAIKKCLFLSESLVAVASVDGAIRFWDIRVTPVAPVGQLLLTPAVTDLKYIDDHELVVTHGNCVSFVKINDHSVSSSFKAPCALNAVAIHPFENVLVCGGDDFAVYKFSFDGQELEHFKCHFGAIHCISYSPDGNVYASGSEDGTIRIYQNVIGSRYGLWKVITDENESDVKND